MQTQHKSCRRQFGLKHPVVLKSRHTRRRKGGTTLLCTPDGGEREPSFFSDKKQFAIQAASCLATAALVDAAWSGDWSRIGAITKETEEALQVATKVVAVERVMLSAFLVSKKDEVEPWTLIQAILGGTLSVLPKL